MGVDSLFPKKTFVLSNPIKTGESTPHKQGCFFPKSGNSMDIAFWSHTLVILGNTLRLQFYYRLYSGQFRDRSFAPKIRSVTQLMIEPRPFEMFAQMGFSMLVICYNIQMILLSNCRCLRIRIDYLFPKHVCIIKSDRNWESKAHNRDVFPKCGNYVSFFGATLLLCLSAGVCQPPFLSDLIKQTCFGNRVSIYWGIPTI